ncbi:hypothetical protein GCM10010277_01610 [Streptomyces longisporoflavus]|uniref:hypothetical protein n=1 Tax=Streptomyces longisporoflavus TaxID=28044 RepID=UPI00167CEA75|nr:hypothetical protein [Streptomyces longisporoflavus]GGV22537.1 hypothetical protein GCM10010277_01610 [Streptomyces longisporoflavus]
MSNLLPKSTISTTAATPFTCPSVLVAERIPGDLPVVADSRPVRGTAAGSGPVTAALPALFRRSPRIRWSR